MPDWTRIVEDHASAVWRSAYRVLRNRDAADECMQEAFVSAMAIPRPDSVRDWRAILTRIATRRAIDHLRARERTSRREDASFDSCAIPSRDVTAPESAVASELATRLRRALADLPTQQAEVFCLRCFSDMEYHEIAEQLGLERSHVGVLLHRARKRLQELMSNQCSDSIQEKLT